MPDPLDSDVDPAEVVADQRLVEDLRGGRIPADLALGVLLAAWKADVDADPPPLFAELAARYGLTVPATAGEDPATTMLPVGRVEYGAAVDWSWPSPADPPARTAGQQDHADPWVHAGGTADPPGPC